LDDAYKAWSGEPFPPASDDHELEGVHADLVLVDTWVAEAVIPFVERTRYVFAAIDVRAAIRGIRCRAEELEASRSGDDAYLAREYIAYADRLDAVYMALERTVSEAAPSN
jgi:hypothetical protein